MKKKIDAIIVVEGITDIAFLNSFIDAEFVSTNGSDVPDTTIAYLKEQSHIKPIVVLTDPDTPGQMIRTKLDANIPDLRHCFLNKKDAVKKGKVGVAEAERKTILKALDFQLVTSHSMKSDLREIDLFKLGLVGTPNSSKIRIRISDRFHLGYVNGKQLLKRARSLNLSYQQLEEAVREIR